MSSVGHLGSPSGQFSLQASRRVMTSSPKMCPISIVSRRFEYDVSAQPVYLGEH
jgi:hypothetical protein